MPKYLWKIVHGNQYLLILGSEKTSLFHYNDNIGDVNVDAYKYNNGYVKLFMNFISLLKNFQKTKTRNEFPLQKCILNDTSSHFINDIFY